MSINSAPTATERTIGLPAQTISTANRAKLDLVTLALFATAIFTSATLLFVVQPMVGKILLPNLGGAPAVWNTCMVFFQATLLAGYLTAHLLSKYLPLPYQIAIYVVGLIAAIASLPIQVGPEWIDQLVAGKEPVSWLLTVLLFQVAPVFFILSTTSPLMQKWFAKSGHPQASDPYFLYAASNVGSILALLAYPFVVEASLGVSEQTHSWMLGFWLLRHPGHVLWSCCLVWKQHRIDFQCEERPTRRSTHDRAGICTYLAASRTLGTTGLHPFKLDAGRHDLYLDRRICYSTDLGHPLGDVLADVCLGVFENTVVFALLDGAHRVAPGVGHHGDGGVGSQ